ncbi:hypothetical protein GGR51DRAFT_549957 [Nemania sp. FL0031]|nr:hypothetical protein GGR51DRAFT_549957 [Nemania sp. FL0031]
MSRLRHDNPFLVKRDACSDVFGPGHSANTCSPNETLCCYQSGQAFPRCEVHLDRGWCCVGSSNDDRCYVDQSSACDTPNAVPCTNLAEGVSQACCPPLTSCSYDYNATQNAIRCDIQYGSLILLDVQSTTLTSTSTTSFVTSSTSTSLSAPSTLTQDPSETTSPVGTLQSGQGLSRGGITGTVVGSVAGVAIAGVVAYYFLRRRWIAKYVNPIDPSKNSNKTPTVTRGNAPVMDPWQHTQLEDLSPEHTHIRYELPANR